MMTDKEYEELEKLIEERKRIKAMADDLAKSKKETAAFRKSQVKKDGTSITKAYGGSLKAPSRAKIAGDSFASIQIRQS